MTNLRDLNLQGKRTLVRVDFNVPMNDRGDITDDLRIRMALPTLEYLIGQNAKIILCSHLGRPKGKRAPRCVLQEAVVSIALDVSDVVSKIFSVKYSTKALNFAD